MVFLVVTLGFPICNITSSANNGSFTSFCLSYLITVARISNTVLNKSGDDGILVLFLILEKMFQLFTVEWDVGCGLGLVICGFYYVDICSPVPTLGGVFIINGCWILSKAFSASIEMIMWFLFNMLNAVYYIYLCILNHPCTPMINPTWSWCLVLLMHSSVLFAQCFVECFFSFHFLKYSWFTILYYFLLYSKVIQT